MTCIFIDSNAGDDERRARLYLGDLFIFQPRPTTLALCDLARCLLEEAVRPHDPRTLHESLPPEDCARLLGKLKPAFIHHPEAKRLIPALLEDLACDLGKVYFDVPRLRSAYPGDYLSSGIAYPFHAHRDTWYSAPMCQLNWWLPIYDIRPDNGMAFFPRYFDEPVRNSSEAFNYYRWNAYRPAVAEFVKSDPREQPRLQQPIDRTDIRLVCPPGGMIVFSGAQLHETVPNTSGVARYSVDFRTVHLDDVLKRDGARNIDTRCTGTTMRDYLRAADLIRLPDEVVALYDDDSAGDLPVLYVPG